MSDEEHRRDLLYLHDALEKHGKTILDFASIIKTLQMENLGLREGLEFALELLSQKKPSESQINQAHHAIASALAGSVDTQPVT